MIVLLGDIFEGHEPPDARLLSIFHRLSAPMGVWAVQGNHEFHRRNGQSQIMAQAGFTILRNQWVEISPGFILAGVDDLTTQRRKNHQTKNIVSQTLSGRPQGATVLLSHTPWETETAAECGANLMLCGHTHGGQIWPFGYLVRRIYPLLEGRYDVAGMTVIVCRGTGTWGPRMRLWRSGEILRITLHSVRNDKCLL